MHINIKIDLLLPFWSSPRPRFRRAQSKTTESLRYAALVQRASVRHPCGRRQGQTTVPRQGLLSSAEHAERRFLIDFS